MTIQAGQMLLHYRLVEKIGEGGMGEVCRYANERVKTNSRPLSKRGSTLWKEPLRTSLRQ